MQGNGMGAGRSRNKRPSALSGLISGTLSSKGKCLFWEGPTLRVLPYTCFLQ